LGVDSESRAIAVFLALAVLSGGCHEETKTKPAPPAQVRPAQERGASPEVELTPEAEKRLGLATAPVELGEVGETRSFAGEILAASGASVALSAAVAGAVLAPDGGAPVVPGARVRKGQTIFILSPIERDLGAEAERDLAAARARSSAATAKARRTQTLLREGAASERAVEEADADAAAAEAELHAAESRASKLDRAGGGLRAVSPLDGIVARLEVAPGQIVPQGAALATIAKVDSVWVRVPVYAGERPALRADAEATVRPLSAAAAPGRAARPVLGPPTSQPSTATVDLYYELPNRDAEFHLGERVDVTVLATGSSRAATVPASAILIDALGNRWVYVVTGPHKYARRHVDVRALTAESAVLATPLAPGTEVVTAGAPELFGSETGVGH